MQRKCDSCGKTYEAKRAASRFCTATCRKRAQRAPSVVALPPPDVDDTPSTPAASGLVSATIAELEEAGRLGTVLGQQAVELAKRVSSPHETGASVASLSKELRAVMESAMEGVGVASDPLDELRARRDRKRNAG